MKKSYLLLMLVCSLALTMGCKSKFVSAIDGLTKEACACKDRACAIKVGQRFNQNDAAMRVSFKGKWSSGKGKKLAKALPGAWKAFYRCFNKLNPSSKGTAFCQKDKAAKGSSKGCKACCNSQGRLMKYWSSSIAGGLAKMFGKKLKGCACK